MAKGFDASTREAASEKPCAPPPRVYASPFDTNLQVVQRSLSGGFLTEDAALLNANVRSMFDEAGHQKRLGRVAPDESPTRRRAALRSQEERPARLDASCELWEVT